MGGHHPGGRAIRRQRSLTVAVEAPPTLHGMGLGPGSGAGSRDASSGGAASSLSGGSGGVSYEGGREAPVDATSSGMPPPGSASARASEPIKDGRTPVGASSGKRAFGSPGEGAAPAVAVTVDPFAAGGDRGADVLAAFAALASAGEQGQEQG